MAKAPYFIKIRRHDHGRRIVGELYGSHDEPVEGIFATAQGAINVKMWDQDGTEVCTIRLMPWPDDKGIKRGRKLMLYHGPVAGPNES